MILKSPRHEASEFPDTGKPQELRDEQGSHFTRGSLLVEVDVPTQPTITLYSIIGDWGVVALSLIGVLMAWLLPKLERNQTSSMQSP